MTKYKYYKNILLTQVEDIGNLFIKIFEENNINQIIEIGTNKGGLSIWLSDHSPQNCKILTIDINKNYIEFDPEEYSNVIFEELDCFSPKGHNLIKNWIEKNNQTLILCDGGEKNDEFKIFSKYLKTNDIIMLHDYIDYKNNIWSEITKKYLWNWDPESSREAIEESIEKNKLKEYLYEFSCQHLWGCFRKT